MPIQSYLMMYFAGSAWQFGKRKISAKSNEEFNKLTMKTLLEEHTMELKSVIPTLEQSLKDVTPLTKMLIEQYGEFAKLILANVPVVSRDVLVGDQGIFSPTQVGNAQAIQDMKDWINRNFPNIPTAEAELLIDKFAGDFKLDQDLPEFKKASTFIGPPNPLKVAGSLTNIIKSTQTFKSKEQRIETGQAGLKISQKVQRIPLTRTQETLFKKYTAIVIKNNGYKNPPQRKNPPSAKSRALLRNAIIINDKIIKKYIVRINEAKSVNLKGFELYYKWLATQ